MNPAQLKILLENPHILHEGHPVLRQRAKAVSPKLRKTPEFAQLIEVMVNQMREAPGVGLAAPQIGVSLRVMVMEDKMEYIERLPEAVAQSMKRRPLPLTVLINPAIKKTGTACARFREGCLSVPGLSADVMRALLCEVDALGPDGKKVHLSLEGWPARILQHEVDHLNGVLYTDRMEPESLLADEPAPSTLSEAEPN